MTGGMGGLAAFLEAGPATGARFAARDWGEDARLARELLAGRELVSVADILAQVGEGLPVSLLGACLAVCRDRAEVAALLMGPGAGPAVGLEEVASCGPAEILSLARRMAPPERAWFFRLVSSARKALDLQVTEGPGDCLAVLTMVEAGGLGQFALRRGNGLVPLAKLPLGRFAPEVMAWARGAVIERFGPLAQLRAEQVFRIGWEGKLANGRRKLGYDLVGGRVLDWERGATPDQIAQG